MNKIQVIVKTIVVLVILASCSSASEDKRYRDTSVLERPPILVVKKKTVVEAPIVETKEVSEGATQSIDEANPVDNSVIRKRPSQIGLGDAVYMVAQQQANDDIWGTPPSQLIIKQAYDDAWNTLGLALKQSDIEITDHEHDKGRYYVSYDPDPSLFSRKNSNSAIYVLTLVRQGAETKITALLGNAAEQNSASSRTKSRGSTKDNSATQPASGAEDLLKSLYETMRDELKEE